MAFLGFSGRWGVLGEPGGGRHFPMGAQNFGGKGDFSFKLGTLPEWGGRPPRFLNPPEGIPPVNKFPREVQWGLRPKWVLPPILWVPEWWLRSGWGLFLLFRAKGENFLAQGAPLGVERELPGGALEALPFFFGPPKPGEGGTPSRGGGRTFPLADGKRATRVLAYPPDWGEKTSPGGGGPGGNPPWDVGVRPRRDSPLLGRPERRHRKGCPTEL